MWKTLAANKINDEIGHLNLQKLDSDGGVTTERLTLPVSINEGFSWDKVPDCFDDNAIIDLMVDLIKDLQIGGN
jgi:hypothetical protein